MGQGVPTGWSAQFSHLDTAEQYAARLCRVYPISANEDNTKWTCCGTNAICFKDIEECTEVSDSDIRIFSFRHAYG